MAADAERASGFRYGQATYLVQFKREGAGLALIDTAALTDLSAFGDAVGEVARLGEPPLVIAALGLVLAGAHLLIFFEVVTLVGRGEGMASALHHFPLSPAPTSWRE